MRKAALHTLGCKVNSYETEAMEELLEDAGYEIVDFTEKADVYIINTCSVTNIADKKSRQMIHRAKSRNPDAVVVACGCYVNSAEDKLREDTSCDILIGNNRKADLIEILDGYFEGKTDSSVTDISEENEYEPLHISRHAERARAFVKVQDGCNMFCSYCIIPYARGRSRSRDPEDVVNEVKTLAEKGYHEIVLTGICLSAYGRDLAGEKTDLSDLIERIHPIDGIERIRFGSLEPNVITEDFVKKLAGMPKICPHFHLSLQSGCDATLKRMNRHYTTEEYLEKCDILRSYFKAPAITTDVITGFPGETREEFEATEEFVKKVHFYEMHVFKYSRRAGTRADSFPDQIPENIKTERSARLLKLSAQMSKEFRETFLGSETSILTEEEMEMDGKKYMTGYTKEYIRAAIQLDEADGGDDGKTGRNRMICGKLDEFLTDDIIILRKSEN